MFLPLRWNPLQVASPRLAILVQRESAVLRNMLLVLASDGTGPLGGCVDLAATYDGQWSLESTAPSSRWLFPRTRLD